MQHFQGYVEYTGNNSHKWPAGGCFIGSNNSFAKGPLAIAGMAQKLRVSYDAASGVGESNTFTVYKNGVATALTVTVSDTDAIGTCDAGVTFADGDEVMILDAHSAGSSSGCVTYHFEIVP